MGKEIVFIVYTVMPINIDVVNNKSVCPQIKRQLGLPHHTG